MIATLIAIMKEELIFIMHKPSYIMKKEDTMKSRVDQEIDDLVETDRPLTDAVSVRDHKLNKKWTKKFILTSRKSRDTSKTTMCFGTDSNGSISKITSRINLTLTNHLLIYSRETETI